MTAPPHEPRSPLQDWLYEPMHQYRTAKACGMKYAMARARKRCLELIAEIKKGGSNEGPSYPR